MSFNRAVDRAVDLVVSKSTVNLRATIRVEFPKLTPAELRSALDIARTINPAAFGLVTTSGRRGTAPTSLADTPETLSRMARAAGCPDGEPAIPWLIAHGLVEQIGADGGFRFQSVPGPLIRIMRGAEVDGDSGRHGIWSYQAPLWPLCRGFASTVEGIYFKKYKAFEIEAEAEDAA